MSNRGVPGPEGPNADVARRVDPNADPLFKRPFLVVLILAGVGGMLDADDYLTYGVFTATRRATWCCCGSRCSKSPVSRPVLEFDRVRPRHRLVVHQELIVVADRGPWFATPLFTAAIVLAVTSVIGGRVSIRAN